jgi:poly-gamma-glutamate synthesis protein (capsule biosynthesis protein)
MCVPRLYLVAVCFSLCACLPRPVSYAALNTGDDGDGYAAELALVTVLFEDEGLVGFRPLVPEGVDWVPLHGGEKPGKKIAPDFFVDFYSSWETYRPEKESGPFDGIPLSRAWFVPWDDPLSARRETVLEKCLSGEESLTPLGELRPPRVALRVDGFSAEDEGYPLVRTAGIVLRIAEAEGNVNGKKAERRKARLSKQAGVLAAALRAALIRSTPNPLMEERPDLVWIAAGGDVMLDRGASGILFNEGPEGIFGGTAQFLSEADLALINLEGCVSERGERVKKSFNFRFDPRVVPALKNSGIDAALIANNHIYDYGETAFLDTMRYLEDAGVGVLGAGLDIDAASAPHVFTKGGITLNVFGLASYPREKNGWDGLTVAAEADKAGLLHAGKGGAEKLASRFSRSDDVLDIVLFHGGEEWSRRPDGATRDLYTGLIREGADLVIGSHPHITQGFEWVDGKAVFWSLGNYVFGGMENTEGGEEGLFIRLGYAGSRLVYLEPYALTLTHTRTDIAPPEKLTVFYTRSKELVR